MKRQRNNHIQKLQVKLHWSDTSTLPVGTLFQPQRGGVVFEFQKDFLSSGLSISPFKLPLQTGIQLAKTEDIGFGGTTTHPILRWKNSFTQKPQSMLESALNPAAFSKTPLGKHGLE